MIKICIVENNNTNFFALSKNAHSLLSSNWMFLGDTKNVLMPFLLNVINGAEHDLTLSPTSFFQASALGSLNKLDLDKPVGNEIVAVIQVHHPIFKYDQFCGPKGTQTIIQILESWKTDDNIVAVVMDYNSGGGQAPGTREAARYIFDYPKPVVSYTNDICGSAAFYMYAAANYRYINQYADLIGCIGAMWYNIDLEGAIEKAGGKVNEIYADSSAEKNLQSRELKKGNERPLVEKILNPNAEVFQSDLKEFQPSISERALKGDVFTPSEALAEGLSDEFGTLDNAIAKAWELSRETKQSKTLINNNMNTKELPSLQSALGLDAPLASTEENGSYLNANQLETIENRLVELETSNSTLQSEKDAALADPELTNKLTASENTVTTMEASIDAMLTSAGLDVTGNLAQKTAALGAKVAEMGKADGAKPTAIKVGESTVPKNAFVDSNASHNKIANEILNQ